MQEVYIPNDRIKRITMNSDALKRLERICSCKIGVQEGNSVVIEGDGNAYNEFIAKNIVTALGMGFDMDTALMLKNDDYYFSYIDLRQALGDQKRIIRIKSRIIGEKGKSKKYIESVSSAKMSVYGHTVGFIGKINDVEEAETAVRTLVDGGTHKLAYARMEAHHRKNRQKSRELF